MAKLWILSDLYLEPLPCQDKGRPKPLAFDLLRLGETCILCNPAGTRFANPAFDEALVIALD